MELQHITEILIVVLLSIIGFIGVRIFSSIDLLFKKLDSLSDDFDEKCDTVNDKINQHAIEIATLKAKN